VQRWGILFFVFCSAFFVLERDLRLVFGFWSLVFDFWSLGFGLYSLVFGLWSLGFGLLAVGSIFALGRGFLILATMAM
jgi:hypothetical protein